MAEWEQKFEGSTENALHGARSIAELAEDRRLLRKYQHQDSVIWGSRPGTCWCFPSTVRRPGGAGLELFLRYVPPDLTAQLRPVLAREFDAPQPKSPIIAWGTVVSRWDELRDGVLVPYVDALASS